MATGECGNNLGNFDGNPENSCGPLIYPLMLLHTMVVFLLPHQPSIPKLFYKTTLTLTRHL